VTSTRTTDGRPVAPRRSTLLLTAGLHLLALWPYALSNLVVAGTSYLMVLALWAAFGVVAVLVHRRWGGLAAVVPGVAVLTWFVVLSVGESLLGWTA
jgi:hypothetical protein